MGSLCPAVHVESVALSPVLLVLLAIVGQFSYRMSLLLISKMWFFFI